MSDEITDKRLQIVNDECQIAGTRTLQNKALAGCVTRRWQTVGLKQLDTFTLLRLQTNHGVAVGTQGSPRCLRTADIYFGNKTQTQSAFIESAHPRHVSDGKPDFKRRCHSHHSHPPDLSPIGI